MPGWGNIDFRFSLFQELSGRGSISGIKGCQKQGPWALLSPLEGDLTEEHAIAQCVKLQPSLKAVNARNFLRAKGQAYSNPDPDLRRHLSQGNPTSAPVMRH